MRPRLLSVICALAFSTPLPTLAQQGSGQGAAVPREKGGTDDTGPYQVVPGFFKPLKEGYLERGVSVFAESPDRIYVTTDRRFQPPAPGAPGTPTAPASQEAYPTIQVLDGQGNLIEQWTQWEGLLRMPHFITQNPYDPEKAVWVIERENHQIFKFSNDGKRLLLTLGEKGVSASDQTHFGRPSAMAFLPDGSFYVADGYANRRVVKFDKDGKYLLEWGGVGTGPGQFAERGEVHSIAIDARRRIYVGDRGNRRVQVFDENGKFLDEWPNIQGPSDIDVTAEGVWVTSGVGNRLALYDFEGHLLTYWGMFGTFPGAFGNPHFISVDSEGSLYVAMWNLTKVGLEKYVPKPNPDRRRLIGQPVRLK